MFDSVIDRETEPIGLSRSMVRVLPDDHDLYTVQWTIFEGSEDPRSSRIAYVTFVFLLHLRLKRFEIVLVKFLR